MPQKLFNAFISYSRKDGVDFVNRLRKKLKSDEKGKQLNLWKDREQMEGDVSWWKQITDAIDNSEYLILVITPESLKSGVCQKEWRYARQVGVCVSAVKGVSDSQMQYDLLPNSIRNVHIYDIDQEWAKFVNDLCRSCQVKRVPFMAPELPTGFVHRDELMNSLKQQLLVAKGSNNNVALTSALRGAGGFGKTTLAAAICHDIDIRDHFSAGILWMTIGEEGDILKEIKKLYNALSNDSRQFVDKEEGARILSEILEQGDYLLVIDDVWKFRHLQPLLLSLRTVRLITTRVVEVARSAEAVVSQVNEMKKSEALQMLIKGWQLGHADRLKAEQLVSDVGEWPLLIKLMRSAAIARLTKGDPIKNALDYLEEKYRRGGLIGFDLQNSDSRNDAVSICLEASLNMLPIVAKKSCLDLGIFPTDTPIPTEVIYAFWGIDSFEGEEILVQLDEYSLIEFDMNKKVVNFHDVMLHYYRLASNDTYFIKQRQLTSSWNDPYSLPNLYAWQRYVWHLREGEQNNMVENTLSDYHWIKGKLEKTNVHELLNDFDEIALRSIILRLIYKAISMSSHVLLADKSNLAFQLSQRLRCRTNNLPAKFITEIHDGLHRLPFIPVTTPMLPVGSLNYLVRQESAVTHCIAWNQNAVIGLADGKIKIVRAKDGVELQEFQIHSLAITSMMIEDDVLISASKDKTLRIFDLKTGSVLQHFDRQNIDINYMAISKGVLIAASECELHTWNLTSGNLLNKFSTTQTINCLAGMDEILVCGSGEMLESWNLFTGEPLNEFKGHHGLVDCIAITDMILLSGSRDGTIKSWNLITGEIIHDFLGHEAPIRNLKVFGKAFVSYSSDGVLRSWNLITGETLYKFFGNSDFSSKIEIVDNVLINAGYDNTLRTWDLISGNIVQELTSHTDRINCVALIGGKLLSGSNDKTLRSWDFITADVLDQNKNLEFQMLKVGVPADIPINLHSHNEAISCVAAKGNLLVSGSYDKTLQTWDLATGNTLRQFEGHTGEITCVKLENNILASGSRDGTHRTWDLTTGNPLHVFKGHSTGINCMAISNDTLISGSRDYDLRSWNFITGVSKQEFKGHQGGINCLEIAGSLCISGSNDKTLRSWDMTNGNMVHEFKGHGSWVTSVAIKDNLLVSGNYDRTLRTWDLFSGTSLHEFNGHSSWITCLAIEKNILVSGGNDNTLRSWNLLEGNALHQFKGHTGRISCVALIGELLLSGSYDQTFRCWDIKTGKCISCLFFDEIPISLAVDESNKTFGVGGKNGGLYVFNVNKILRTI